MAQNSSSGVWGLLAVLVLIVGALCYYGVFYQTGAQYYDACWKKLHANGREPNSPDEAAAWGRCDETAQSALFGAGFVFSGNPQYAVTPQLKAVVAACPSNYNDIPIGGAWMLAVKMIEQSGGPTSMDRFAPASSAILRVYQERWPQCAYTAALNGFPRLVKRNGDWQFESPCLPCAAEQKAMQGQ